LPHKRLHGEAEAGAGDLAAARLVGAVEAFAETRQVFALDAGASLTDSPPSVHGGFDQGGEVAVGVAGEVVKHEGAAPGNGAAHMFHGGET
jgi:hypothetical protein